MQGGVGRHRECGEVDDQVTEYYNQPYHNLTPRGVILTLTPTLALTLTRILVLTLILALTLALTLVRSSSTTTRRLCATHCASRRDVGEI